MSLHNKSIIAIQRQLKRNENYLVVHILPHGSEDETEAPRDAAQNQWGTERKKKWLDLEKYQYSDLKIE